MVIDLAVSLFGGWLWELLLFSTNLSGRAACMREVACSLLSRVSLGMIVEQSCVRRDDNRRYSLDRDLQTGIRESEGPTLTGP